MDWTRIEAWAAASSMARVERWQECSEAAKAHRSWQASCGLMCVVECRRTVCKAQQEYENNMLQRPEDPWVHHHRQQPGCSVTL